MLSNCPVSCDSCNDIGYNVESIGCPHKYPDCESCEDISEHCQFWSTNNECKVHPGHMVINCAHSCKYCHLQSNYSLRCQLTDEYRSQSRVFPKAGDLNLMFENILQKYKDLENNINDKQYLDWSVEVLSKDPWVIRLDDMFNAEEAQAVINTVIDKFERSTDVGIKDNTGHFGKIVSTSRTSANAWCQHKCWDNPIVQKVMARAEYLLNISLMNTEHLQILKYIPEQYYRLHHDFIAEQVNMPCGPRILTWFMYLSDVEEGGATAFPELGIVNEPKIGRVLLWTSVLDSDPTKKDLRTKHEALPVLKGVKYAANAWYHLYDFQTPNLWSCTG